MSALALARQRVGPSAGLTTEVVADGEAFARLRAEWNDAVARAGIPHPFLRHEWIYSWWECFGGGRQLRIIVVRRGADIVGIAPMMSEHVVMCGVPVRKLDLLHNDHTPRTDIVVADTPAEIYPAIWQAIIAMADHWDVIQVSRVTNDSPTVSALQTLSAPHGLRIGLWRGDDSPYLPLAGSFESCHAALSGKFRSNLRNRLGRLTRLGEVALEIVEGRTDVERACEEALRLEASGWKERSGTAISSAPDVRRFYTLVAGRGADDGWLRLLFLTVDGRRIAAAYAACFERRLYLIKTGYDPAFAACAPFKLLTWFAIRQAYAEGLREVDFLGDAEPWKLEWTMASRPHHWLFVFSNTVRARLLHSLKFRIVPELKRWRA